MASDRGRCACALRRPLPLASAQVWEADGAGASAPPPARSCTARMADARKDEQAPEGDPSHAPALNEPVGETGDERPSVALSRGTSTRESRRGSRTAAENLLGEMLNAEQIDGRYELQRALFCLAPDNPLRLVCIRMIRHPMFDRAAMAAILASCLQMATVDPLLDTTSAAYADRQRAYLVFNSVLVPLFTLEMIVKVLAMGFVLHRNAYLRDKWNWVDFTCVVSGWVDLASTWGGGGSSASVLTSLRAVRVLRPLRTLTQLPGMHELIGSLLGSLPQLGNVVGVLLFFLLIFGVLGVQLFNGQLRHQCWAPDDGGAWASTGDVCNPFGDPLTYQCPPPAECRCGASGLVPQLTRGGARGARSSCVESDNPNFGITHFDHTWAAFITIFQSITLEGWVDNMYFAQDGAHLYTWAYFVLVVAFGAFLVVQLFLAVLTDAFNRESDRAHGAPAAAEAEERYADEDGDGIMDLDMAGRPWLQRRCYALVSAAPFRHGIHGAIMLNTLLMCCEYYGQPVEEELILASLNYALTVVFSLELLAKLLAMGARNAMRDAFNRFDAAVVLLSLLEVALDFTGASFVNLAVLRTFRLLRLVRVLKLVRSLDGLNRLMRALVGSLREVSSLALLLLLLVIVYALLGIELFGGIYTQPPRGRNPRFDGDGVPSANFDSLAMACISIFIVISGENWNEVYFDTAHGLETLYQNAASRELATLYFLSLFILGNYVVFNLFVAIILRQIDLDDDAQALSDAEKASRVEGTGKIVFAFGTLVHVDDEHAQRIHDGAGSRAILAELHSRPFAGANALPEGVQSISQLLFQRANRSSTRTTVSGLGVGLGPLGTAGATTMAAAAAAAAAAGCGGGADDPVAVRKGLPALSPAANPRGVSLGGTTEPDVRPDRSLALFSRSHPVRRACVRLLSGGHFDRAVLVLICASSISLAYDTPSQTALTTDVLRVLNWIFTLAFAVEMLVKVVALGFVWPAGSAYLRSAWNVLDFAIVSISVVLLALEESGGDVSTRLSWLKALRVVRALRPLRMANRVAGMKKVVTSLFMAVPQCANVSLLMGMFVLVFAIVGVQLFKGKFYECTDGMSPSRAECLAAGGRWVNPPFGNFDHVGVGVLVLLEMVGLEGWPSVMFRAIYATDIDRAPLRDDRSPRVLFALFFIVWIFAGAFLVWNMFVGVVLDTFNTLRKRADGTAFMTASQRDWMEAQRAVYAMRPIRQFTCPSRLPARQRAFRLVQSSAFELGIMCAIVANAVVMMLEWHDSPRGYSLGVQALSYAFALVFCAEMMLKLTALGGRQYITNGWNAFDALLVVLSVVDLTLELAGGALVLPINPNTLRVLRMFRVVRLLRVVKTAKGLRTLLVTLWSSLPALQNVGLLLGLVMYIYAIAGVFLFADVPFGECLTRHANFRGFWVSLLTLFRCSTGESWNCLMHDAMGADWADNAARCTDASAGACGSTTIAALYFLSYWILGQAILLNLVIGVILENFSAIGSESKPITVEQLEARARPRAAFAARPPAARAQPIRRRRRRLCARAGVSRHLDALRPEGHVHDQVVPAAAHPRAAERAPRARRDEAGGEQGAAPQAAATHRRARPRWRDPLYGDDDRHRQFARRRAPPAVR